MNHMVWTTTIHKSTFHRFVACKHDVARSSLSSNLSYTILTTYWTC